MKKRFLTSIVLAGVLAFGALTGCGSSAESEAAQAEETQAEETQAQETQEAEATEQASDEAPAQTEDGDKTIRVGATPVPHAEILDNIVKEVLAEDGWTLETVVFSDYVLPNTSLEADELDANYFQTLGYMNQQNTDAGLHLAAVAGVHIEPMGIYSQKYTSLEELPDGASIGIPNDPDNGERALDLLVQKGLLASKGGFGTDDSYTEDSLTNDAEANPHGYVITPLEAASLPLSLPDLDAAAINGNYALEADLPSTYPALDIEEFDDETTVKRTNFLVVKQGNETSEKTQALIKALQSDKVQAYIDETYKGAVITSFIDAQ
ncbi:MAG: MetQ/NlpA family ABC transporter substrate-binding protein [Butyrivibrio sp.]|uniref:MetQ/NlpA family ABC transporter substrate-binding protein n=1 Tax=Butyrivibrio sp. TaxID=28121 RepID=UPI001B0E1C35|nr:MetQ/NlpA family ABC transporter substrate-binding protein [Butyrivibrio sp.]MBO6239585.1 MetQ/NlpA family ABC transporter substrate-binding protein [Butyrivibrio sp.]